MNLEPINIWTNTLYTLVHSFHLSKAIHFGSLDYLEESARDAATSVRANCSYNSVLLASPDGGKHLKFRREAPACNFSSKHSLTATELGCCLTEVRLMRAGAQVGDEYPRANLNSEVATYASFGYTAVTVKGRRLCSRHSGLLARRAMCMAHLDDRFFSFTH